MSRSDVLIVSNDPVVAALLGASVELAGFAPAFAENGERLEALLRRTRPGVVLVDGSDDRWSESGAPVVRSVGARLVFFGPRARRVALEAAAAKAGAHAITMPIGHGELARLLGGAD